MSLSLSFFIVTHLCIKQQQQTNKSKFTTKQEQQIATIIIEKVNIFCHHSSPSIIELGCCPMAVAKTDKVCIAHSFYVFGFFIFHVSGVQLESAAVLVSDSLAYIAAECIDSSLIFHQKTNVYGVTNNNNNNNNNNISTITIANKIIRFSTIIIDVH
ncbi:hypothetical protein DFA_01243 [Cavenderia fasciculata]|uniref:Uncharacterized protein n=1 Tax=Cavenderia fasciculata TaxID=261658 RepID=F4PRM2_CACFS|nr:uncharacterized protein DFA_01243 [Cavenderia fasciculata]EGG21362.1 hypothetical protein DFA_01243 [Cavenderia fasciculata]|eukprot:XP_004359212.1 hypothetical protein DFA_01243 [Cavenderia fasciculata]